MHFSMANHFSCIHLLAGGIFLPVVPAGQIKKLQESYQQNLIHLANSQNHPRNCFAHYEQ
jgi:hypothetical protein